MDRGRVDSKAIHNTKKFGTLQTTICELNMNLADDNNNGNAGELFVCVYGLENNRAQPYNITTTRQLK